MPVKLRVHPDFYTEFAEKQWHSAEQALIELVENSYDADSTKVLVTFLPDSIIIEDDAGMDERSLSSSLQLGGRHQNEEFTPSGRRVVGKYRVGRMSVFGSFNAMRVKTRYRDFFCSFVLTFEDLQKLHLGSTELEELKVPPINRERGSEISLLEPRGKLPDYDAVKSQLSSLPILRTHGFEVYIKKSQSFSEWNLGGAERILPKDIPGAKVPVAIKGKSVIIAGVITLADDSALPLADEDRGIGIVVSSHLVTRSYFGLEASGHRFDKVTGYVECNQLTTTFGTKDRLIEDEKYAEFTSLMKDFVREKIVPALQELETRRVSTAEVKIVRKVDRVLGKILYWAGFLPKFATPVRFTPSILREKVNKENIVKQTKEVTTIMVDVEEEAKHAVQPAPELPAPASDTRVEQVLEIEQKPAENPPQ